MKIEEMNKENLQIIKDFIDIYEKVEQKYKEYCILCESIRKNIIYQKNKKENISLIENCKNIDTILTKQIIQSKDKYRKKLLEQQKENLNIQIEEIKKYLIIEKIYNEMYYGNLSKYFQEEPEEEKETVKYNIKDELQEKDYYYNKKSTITQIYIRLKYLYNFNKKEDNKENTITDFEFLKNNLKFYQIFKPALIKFISNNKQNVEGIIENIENQSNKEQENIRRIK